MRGLMSILMLVFALMFAAAVVLWVVSLRKSARNQAELNEPLCARCRYCVRGLEGTTCPECGGDLREIGIIQPGAPIPFSPRRRLLIWTLAAALPGMVFGIVLADQLGPKWEITTQRRVIFSQAPYCRVTLTANTHNKQLVFGRGSFAPTPLIPEIIFLSNGSANPNTSMDIRVPDGLCRFPDATGKRITVPYDAKAIEQWLNVQGFSDPRVAERAKDVFDALAEIGTTAGHGFSSFALEAGSTTLRPVVAHPTFASTRPQANELTHASAIAVGLLFWLAGVPLVLRPPWVRRRTRVRPVIEPLPSSPQASLPHP
jgi:hypothetical protein